MSYLPPPVPVSPKVFKQRWNAGARTLEELDPALYRWKENQDRMARTQVIAILISIALVVITIIMIVSHRMIYPERYNQTPYIEEIQYDSD